MKSFSDEEILRFLYNEMDSRESDAFLDALCSDEALWKRYESFQETVEKIAQAQESPSEEVCDRIMDYVRSSHPEHLPTEPVLAEGSSRSWSNLLPASVNFNAVLVVAMLLFISAGVTGSFIQLHRSTYSQPDVGTLVQHENRQAPIEPIFQWDDSALEEELDNIRQQVESMRSEEIL